MKKLIALMLCLVFCVGAFAGCGDSLGKNEKGPEIRMYLSDYPYSLDPAILQQNSDIDQLLALIFEPLATIDADGKVQPALATEWYYDYDEIWNLHKMYFKLKDTAWSDKRAVSADDVIYAWSRILSPDMDSPYASLLYGIKGARDVKAGVATIDDLGLAAVDDTLLEVTFEYDYNYDLFVEQIANVHLAPCREDVVTRCEKDDKDTDWAGSSADIVCNGKFKVAVMDMPYDTFGEDLASKNFSCRLVLERNAFYMRDFEDEDVALDEYVTPYRISCYFSEGQTAHYPNELGITQEAFQSNRYDNGEVYLLGNFDASTYAKYQSSIKTSKTLNGHAFYFNNNTLDVNVRNALSAALDRNAIVAATGTGDIAATGYVPNGVFNTDSSSDFRSNGGTLYNTSADTAKAKDYLSKSSDKPSSITMAYLVPQNDYTISHYSDNIDYNSPYKIMAEKAAEAWEALGIDVKLVALDPEEYNEALKNLNGTTDEDGKVEDQYDVIGVNILSGSTDAFFYLAPYAKAYSGVSTTNIEIPDNIGADEEIFNPHYTYFENADYDALIDSALASSDRGQRADYLHQAEALLVEQCPAAMVCWYTASYVAKDSISGFDTDSWFGYFDFTDLTLEDWRDVNASEAEVSAARNDAVAE